MIMKLPKRYKWWIAWGLLSVVILASLLMMLTGKDRSFYLSGRLTNGHYQIGVKCATCHQHPFGGDAAIQKACVECHQQDLKLADDSHPRTKFTDPRNADRVKALDARNCATCHAEHAPERTHDMGVTLAPDFCVSCHKDVGKDRPSHRDLAFDSCASAGCHNFHDNRALYEDFLVQHAGETDTLAPALVPSRNNYLFRTGEIAGREPLTAREHDGPKVTPRDSDAVMKWAASAHAKSGVNCTDCHLQKNGSPATVWTDHPGRGICTDCHQQETDWFKQGRHGMRLAQELPPMRPELARQPMKPRTAQTELDCNACHNPHQTDIRRAAVESCLGCHDDEHSRAYKQSPHYTLWTREGEKSAAVDSGVSCATCHLPRENHPEAGRQRIRVQHNANFNLRPNEKMIRGVCLQCHGLAFSIDALADRKLIARNFKGQPATHINSIDWALRREKPKPRPAS